MFDHQSDCVNSVVVISIIAVFSSLSLGLSNSAFAQYASQNPAEPTQAQLEECEKLGIDPSQCTDNTILAKQRLLAAQQVQATGSGQLIYLSGIANSTRYEVQVEWTPANIGNANKFNVRILDPNQPEPRNPLNVNYNVKIFKDGNYLLPEFGARQGDSSTDYAFIFLQEGSYTFTIEIDEGNEKIDIPIQVTPEFPTAAGAIVVIVSMIIAALIIGRTRLNQNVAKPL